jgi:uracil-DNA glycosylase
MRTFNVIVERDPDTGIFVGSVPGWPGAHSQGHPWTGPVSRRCVCCSMSASPDPFAKRT